MPSKSRKSLRDNLLRFSQWVIFILSYTLKKVFFNADVRRLSRQTINLRAGCHLKCLRLTEHLDGRRFYLWNNLRLSVFKISILKSFISAIVIFLFSGCVTIYNPATQRKETLLIDTKSEVALGRDMDKEIHRKLKILQDPKRQYRLNDLGAKVAAVSDRQDIAYYFRILKDHEFNAFAVPGGYIYVHSGLMDNATDDELACVLAHEIGHIAARHSIKKLQANLGYQIIMSIALEISRQQSIARAVDVLFDLTTLSYSRQDELLADKLAVKYAIKSGFNPYGMITFFQKLEKEAEKKGGKLHIEIFSSHPGIKERIKKVEAEISEATTYGTK